MAKRRQGYLLLILALLGISSLINGPYLSLSRLDKALQAQDEQQLQSSLDLPQLRQHLKQQIDARNNEPQSAPLETSPLALVGRSFADSMAENLVDTLLTPEGLIRLLQPTPEANTPEPSESSSLFRHARTAFASLNRFWVWVPSAQGEVQLTLQREGLTWRLVEITLPHHKESPGTENTSSPSAEVNKG